MSTYHNAECDLLKTGVCEYSVCTAGNQTAAVLSNEMLHSDTLVVVSGIVESDWRVTTGAAVGAVPFPRWSVHCLR